ncbi:mitochondrial dynamin GTPase Msp1 [Massospora cicadina]|nr:mitochondrial dynamin GTPase Msp1 [Massospora cicadina]
MEPRGRYFSEGKFLWVAARGAPDTLAYLLSAPLRLILPLVAVIIVTQVIFFYGLKYLMASLDPSQGKKKDAKSKSEKLLDKYGKKDLQLTEYEQIIATELVHPDEIPINFADVGGLDLIIDELKETVIYPLKYPSLFNERSALLGPPKGVLLYGPPGCGKTMLAKCLAKESGAAFINILFLPLHVTGLRWQYGESNKLVAALFSLARKMQPCIVFIDEIDSFLRERRSNDHEVTGTMKAEFMTLWDGLTSGETSRIIVLGATNRPHDIDQAILRRMPKRFNVSPPNEDQRYQILKLFLKDAQLEGDFDFKRLAEITSGLSGSDLKELCRDASMIPVRESEGYESGRPGRGSNCKFETRELRMTDFVETAIRQGHCAPAHAQSGSGPASFLSKGRAFTLPNLQD